MNRTAAVRDYIAANPGSPVSAVAKGTGLCPRMVSNGCKKMAKRGLLIATLVPGPRLRYVYSQGRAVLIDRTERARMATRAKFANRPANQQPSAGRMRVRALIQDCAKSEPAVKAVAGQSVDEYMANGGRVEVLPGFRYQPPSVLPVGPRYGGAA